MSKQYLTQKQALQKADQDASKASYWFSTKKWLIDQGVFDTSKLTKYDNEDFVIDDDIISDYYIYKIQYLQIYLSNATNSSDTLSYKNEQAQWNNKYKGIFQLQAYDGGIFYSEVCDCEPSHSSAVAAGGFEFRDMTIKIPKSTMQKISSFVAMGITVWTEDTYVVMKRGSEVNMLSGGPPMYYNISQRFTSSPSIKTIEVFKPKTPFIKSYLINSVSFSNLQNAKFGFIVPIFGSGNILPQINVGTTFINSISKTGYNFGQIATTVLLTERDGI